MKVDLLPDGLPRYGYVRLKQVIRPIGPLPVCSATIWNWVTKGYLTPIRLGERVTVFEVEQLRKVIGSRGIIAETGIPAFSNDEVA